MFNSVSVRWKWMKFVEEIDEKIIARAIQNENRIRIELSIVENNFVFLSDFITNVSWIGPMSSLFQVICTKIRPVSNGIPLEIDQHNPVDLHRSDHKDIVRHHSNSNVSEYSKKIKQER